MSKESTSEELELDSTQGIISSRSSSAIILIVFILPIFATILFGAVDNTTWIIITVLSAAIVFLWIVDSWRMNRIVLNTHPLQIPLLGFLLIGLIHLLPFGPPGDIEGLLLVAASNTISLDPHATRFFLTRLTVYIVFFAACLTFMNSETRVRKVILTIVVFGSMMAFFGILQRLANPDGIYGVRETPQAVPFGPFVNQHHFASFMLMTIGPTLGLLFGKMIKRDKKVLLVLALVLMSVATILTSSRGGLLGLISVVGIVTLFNLIYGRWTPFGGQASRSSNLGRNTSAAAVAGGLALVIFVVVLFVGGGESLMRGIGASQSGLDFSSGRSHFWSIALKIFFDYPLIGVGFDAFGVVFTRYDTWSGLFRVEQAHNEYLQVLAEAGFAGFLCLTSFIYLLLRKGSQNITAGIGIVREASIGALAGCFGILVHSFFDFPLRTPSNAFFFLLLCSIAVFQVSKTRKLNEPEQR